MRMRSINSYVARPRHKKKFGVGRTASHLSAGVVAAGKIARAEAGDTWGD